MHNLMIDNYVIVNKMLGNKCRLTRVNDTSKQFHKCQDFCDDCEYDIGKSQRDNDQPC